ncbi:MAG: hypothetical protein ACRYF3_13535 [Janthinobacterium lividum]
MDLPVAGDRISVIPVALADGATWGEVMNFVHTPDEQLRVCL